MGASKAPALPLGYSPREVGNVEMQIFGSTNYPATEGLEGLREDGGCGGGRCHTLTGLRGHQDTDRCLQNRTKSLLECQFDIRLGEFFLVEGEADGDGNG